MDRSPSGSSVHGFSRQEYWNGLPFPTLGDLPDPGIQPVSLESFALAGGCFTTTLPGMPVTGRVDTKQVTYYILIISQYPLTIQRDQPRGFGLIKLVDSILGCGAETEALERGWEGRPGGCSSCVCQTGGGSPDSPTCALVVGLGMAGTMAAKGRRVPPLPPVAKCCNSRL